MIRALLEHASNPSFGIAALMLLFSIFVGILWWTYIVIPKSLHHSHAQIPLNDELQIEQKDRPPFRETL